MGIDRRKAVLFPVFLVVAVVIALALMPAAVTEARDKTVDLFPNGQGSASMITTVGFYGPNGEPIKVDDSWATQSTLRTLSPLDGGADTKYPTGLTEYQKDHEVWTYNCQIHRIEVVGKNIEPSSLRGNWVVKFIPASGDKIEVPETRLYFKADDFDIEGDAAHFTATWFPTSKAFFEIPLRDFGIDNGLDWTKDGFVWTFQIEADFYGTSLQDKQVKAKPFGKKYGIRTSPLYPDAADPGDASLVATVDTCGMGAECDSEDLYVDPSEDILYSYKVCDPADETCLDTRGLGASVLPSSGFTTGRALVLVLVLIGMLYIWQELPLGRR